MAKTQGERLEAIELKLAELERSLELNRTTSDIHSEYTKAAIKELQTIIKELQAVDTRRAEADAKLEQRCAALEKNSDRGFNFGQAAIIAAISMIGGALLSLLVQLTIKK